MQGGDTIDDLQDFSGEHRRQTVGEIFAAKGF